MLTVHQNYVSFPVTYTYMCYVSNFGKSGLKYYENFFTHGERRPKAIGFSTFLVMLYMYVVLS